MQDEQIFVAVVDAGGFSAAALPLGLTVSAVSRRVKALEQRLGGRLLHRTTRRLSLTSAGQIYYRSIKRLLAELREAEAEVAESSSAPKGELRIAAPLSFGLRRLTALIAEFASRHPQLEVRLDLDDRLVDIVDAGFDLALRIGYPQDSSLVSRPLAPIPRCVCASPKYLAARGTPRQPLDLLDHDCLHYRNLNMREEWNLNGPEGMQPVEVGGRFCSNNGEALCEAAVQGLGIALLPEFICAPALAEGRLQRVLDAYAPPPFQLSALYPSRRLVPAKLRALLDFLSAALVAEGPSRGD